MALPKHLDEAAARMQDAARRIEAARARPRSVESLGEWLAALTDYAVAAADVQRFANESVHEKLHELAGHLGHEKLL
jgi:hypothetical protein